MRALGPGSVSSFLKIILDVVFVALWIGVGVVALLSMAAVLFAVNPDILPRAAEMARRGPVFAGGLGDFNIGSQLVTQLLASLYTILLSGIASFVILKVIDATIGLRVSPEEENQGLDLAEHGEAAYND